MRILTTQAITIILCITFSSGLHAQSKGLLEIANLALNNDAQFSAEKYNARAIQVSGSLLRSQLLPELAVRGNYDLNYSSGDYGASSSFSDYEQKFQSRSLGIQLRQPLLRLDTLHQHRSHALNQEIGQLQLASAKQQLLLRVADIYFKNLQERENLAAAHTKKNTFAKSLERAEISFQLGTNTITDKLEAQARFDLARSDEIAARSLYSTVRERLKLVAGNIYDLRVLSENVSLPSISEHDISWWQKRAAAQNFELAQARFRFQQAERDVQAIRAEYLPTIDLVGSVSHYAGLSFGNDQTRNEASAGIQLEMPILSAGASTGKLQQATAVREQRRFELEQTARNIELRTQMVYLNTVDGLSRLNALSQALKSSESAVEATQKGLEVGIRTNLDLLNAQQQFFETKRDLINLRYDYLYAVLELKAITGELDIEDLTKIDRLFK